MSKLPTLDLVEVIEQSPLGLRRLVIFFLIFLFITIEGFDTAAIGFLVPSMVQAFKLSSTEVSGLFAAGMGGLLLSSFVGGMLCDVYGRKRVSVISVLIFGVACIGVALSTGYTELMLWRFATGAGIGAALPALSTLCAELTPARSRSTILAIVFSGFLTGSVLAGLVTGAYLHQVGWEGIMLIGGVVPIAMIVLLAAWMPESPRYLALRPQRAAGVAAAMDRLFPGRQFKHTAFVSHEKPQTGPKARVTELFRGRFAAVTLALWGMNFTVLLSFYTIASWLPSLLHLGGIEPAQASKLASSFQIGALIGSVSTALALRRLRPVVWLGSVFILGGLTPWLLTSAVGTPWFVPVTLLSGFCVAGPVVGLQAVAASVYPTYMRGAGVGWAATLSRVGSLTGASMVGIMISGGLAMPDIFRLMLVPMLLAAACAWFLQRGMSGPVNMGAGGH